MKRLFFTALTFAAIAGQVFTAPAQAADDNVVNLYSYRQPFLINPLLEAFTKETGIQVNSVFVKTDMLQRLKAEGRNTPADVILASDINRIFDLAKANLLQQIDSDVVNANIPSAYRDSNDLWVGLTSRARVLYVSKDRVKPGAVTSYEDLTKPEFKGRICTRSGKHDYNISLLSSVISANGIEKAEAWAHGLKANLARKPQGNDRAQVKAIFEGVCDIAIGNSYYFGKMLTNDKKPEQKLWAAAVRIVFPNQPEHAGGNLTLARGAHINISAGGITKAAKHRDNAAKLLEFLTDSYAQELYAGVDFEYPLKEGTQLHPLVAGWGDFHADTSNLKGIVANRAEASKMMDRVGFDN